MRSQSRAVAVVRDKGTPPLAVMRVRVPGRGDVISMASEPVARRAMKSSW
jgi:hypothetical protein